MGCPSHTYRIHAAAARLQQPSAGAAEPNRTFVWADRDAQQQWAAAWHGMACSVEWPCFANNRLTPGMLNVGPSSSISQFYLVTVTLLTSVPGPDNATVGPVPHSMRMPWVSPVMRLFVTIQVRESPSAAALADRLMPVTLPTNAGSCSVGVSSQPPIIVL